jgi:hypothetical protein
MANRATPFTKAITLGIVRVESTFAYYSRVRIGDC